MDCVRSREAIQLHIEGELSDAETIAFQRHLSFCAACAAELEELSAVRAALAACGAVTVEVPVGFAERVCAQAQGLPQPSLVERTLSAATGGVLPGRVPRRARRIAYGALVVAAVAIGLGRRRARSARELKVS